MDYSTSGNESSRMSLWVIVVALIVIAAGMYYYYYYAKPEAEDAATTRLERQSASDEVAAIEQDLTVTDISNLDQELGDIETELGR